MKVNYMIGLVLVTHGKLAIEFKHAVEHIVGKQEYFETVCIDPHDNIESRRSDMMAAVTRANNGFGVIILTDMFGGTPSNLAISALEQGVIEVIAGVNLPMLIKLSKARYGNDIACAVCDAQEAGRKYINVASQLLSTKT